MLRGASAEAEAQLTSELEGSEGEAGKLGEELFGVAAVLRAEAALRRIFTDASIEADGQGRPRRQRLRRRPGRGRPGAW